MVASLFVILILFQNIILGLIPDIGFLSYWDEFLFLVFFVCYLLTRRAWKIKGKQRITFFVCILAIVILGLTGNIVFSYQHSAMVIIRDIVGFIKFPITLYIFIDMEDTTEKIARGCINLLPVLKVISFIILACGILSIFMDLGMAQTEIRGGINPYMFLYTHPTYLTTITICILCLFDAMGETSWKYRIILLVTVVLGMRTKGLAFVAVYVFIKCCGNWLRRFKILYWVGVIAVIVGVSYYKLTMYASYATSPRETLYQGALQLMGMCFPLGSGFGTFASHLSGKYLSEVYSFIYIADMYRYDGTLSAVIGDAGLPYYMGQFGIIGTLLFALVLWILFKMNCEGLERTNKTTISMLWILLFITLTTEAMLIGNGFELGVIFAVARKISFIQQEGTATYKRVKLKVHS